MMMLATLVIVSGGCFAAPSGNMNGKYAVKTGGAADDGWADWNDDYASKGYE